MRVSDIFSRHICYAVTETIQVTNYATSYGEKKCSKAKFEATDVMILDPWNQQIQGLVARGKALDPPIQWYLTYAKISL